MGFRFDHVDLVLTTLMARRLLAPLAVLIALSVSGTPSAAQTPDPLLGPLAFDPTSGSGLAVYFAPVEGEEREVTVQRVDSTGERFGPRVEVSHTPAGSYPGGPRVVFNPKTREYLVVWTSGPREGRDLPLRGRRVSVSGDPIGQSDFPVGRARVSTFAAPSLAASERTGGYLVAFDATNGAVGARVLDSRGTEVRETRLSSRRDCGREVASAYRSRTDEYVVGWACGLPGEDFAPRVTQYAQRLSGSGREVGGDVRVVAPRHTRYGNGEVDLAYSARFDQFVFVGQCRALICVRRLDGRLRPLGPVRLLRRVSYRVETGSPTVAFDDRAGAYLVVWSAWRRIDSRDVARSLFATRLSARGVESARETLLSAARGDLPSVVATGGSGGFLVSFLADGRGVVRRLAE